MRPSVLHAGILLALAVVFGVRREDVCKEQFGSFKPCLTHKVPKNSILQKHVNNVLGPLCSISTPLHLLDCTQ